MIGSAALYFTAPVTHSACKMPTEAEDDWMIASEMEGTALYTVAPKYKAKALTIMTITQNMWTEELVDNDKKEKALDDMIVLGLETLLD